jgi:hypothetical protein
MGFAGDLLGIGGAPSNSGAAGIGFQASAANISNPVGEGQIDQSYSRTVRGLDQQEEFLKALQAQNGVQNQSDVFAQQQALANQMQGVANGTGPNPALAQLNQTTSNNIANQAALMAGQRGTGANAGLLARQAANQGGQLQQQAVGQGATLQAQQQLAAMGALANQQSNMGNMATTQVGQQAGVNNAFNQNALAAQQNLLNAQGQYNNAVVGSTGSMNSANGSLANNVAGQQGQLFSGAMSGMGAALSDERAKKNIQPGEGQVRDLLDKAQPHAYEYKDPSQPGAGEGTYVSPMAQELEKSAIGQNMVMDTPNGKMVDYGKGLGAMLAAQSMLQKRVDELEGQLKAKSYADGGLVTPTAPMAPQGQVAVPQGVKEANDPAAPQSWFAQMALGSSKGLDAQQPQMPAASAPPSSFEGGKAMGSAMGQGIMALVGSGGGGAAGGAAAGGAGGAGAAAALSDERAKKNIRSGKPELHELLANKGAIVPGKAKVPGDSLKNDTVPAKLSPGEIVLPRSVTMSKDPAKAAADFVAAVLSRQNPKKR